MDTRCYILLLEEKHHDSRFVRPPRTATLDARERLGDDADVVIGNSAEAFGKMASDAAVILNWSGSLCLIRDVFRMSPNLRWIHSRSVGFEQTLFPELIASDVILTNGRVFSPSLGDFVLARSYTSLKIFVEWFAAKWLDCGSHLM